jgi:peptidoglycan/xylan/chitin deacetylase (PgdA/CDA1 family)
MSIYAHIKRAFVITLTATAIAVIGTAEVLPRVPVSAQAVNNGAKVSFTFDDGYKTNLTKAAPALAAYGYTGTAYVTSSFVGKTGYMTWANVQNLQNQFGWEIGGHSVSHPLSTTLTADQLRSEIVTNKQDLVSRGLNARSFATPFGDYNNNVLAEIARSYESHRPFHDRAFNNYPYSDYRIQVQQVQVGVGMSTIKGYVDDAVASGRWLVLVFHNVKDTPSRNVNNYEYATKDLRTIAAYVKSKNLPVVRVSEGIVRGANLLGNGNFTTGIAGGWSTDSAAITADNTNMGVFPESQNSAKLTSHPTQNSHLFSPVVNIDATKQYVFKTYLNVAAISANELGYYIDEYDAAGNWISGQYKLGERSVYVSKRNVAYVPTSTAVASVRFQVIVPAASGVVAYIDGVELIAQ